MRKGRFSVRGARPAAAGGRGSRQRSGGMWSFMAAWLRIGVLPVRPGRGPSPPGTAWKDLKSGVSPSLLPPASRRRGDAAPAACSFQLASERRGVAALAVAVFAALFGWAVRVRVAVLTSCGRGPSQRDGKERLETVHLSAAFQLCGGVASLRSSCARRNALKAVGLRGWNSSGPL